MQDIDRSMGNTDKATAEAFDEKWGVGWTGRTPPEHRKRTFEAFFSLFPLNELAAGEGFDLGCGIGRHAVMIAPRVALLHCIDPSPNGLAAARRLLAGRPNVVFHEAGVDDIPLADGSQDFGYSMGVLHHVPDTEGGLRNCVTKLKAGAPFLLYLYYNFENRPLWFRMIWRLSDLTRRLIYRLPFPLRKRVCAGIALLVYLPLSRTARLLERAGFDVRNLPLSYYRHTPMPNLKVSALDRFGTKLEQRFSKAEIEQMMTRSGLGEILFQNHEPYWVAIGRKI